jgi:hypothetical protein
MPLELDLADHRQPDAFAEGQVLPYFKNPPDEREDPGCRGRTSDSDEAPRRADRVAFVPRDVG